MDISGFFKPVNPAFAGNTESYHPRQFANWIHTHRDNHFPDLEKVQVAIMGVREERKAINNEGCSNAPDTIRKQLYQTFADFGSIKGVDLGDVEAGHTIDDTYFALSATIAELVGKKVIPIIIGGSHDLAFANYMAYEKLEQTLNIVTIDSTLNLGLAKDDELNAGSFLGKIIMRKPNFLFNYSSIAYQTYLTDPEAVHLMRNLHFDCHRLGEVQSAISEMEPAIRNADLFSFDMAAIRMSDAPGTGQASPNGLFGQEACKLMRYAGLSEKISSVGIYECNPLLDRNEQTAGLAAQMIWYFIEGVSGRKYDFPFTDSSHYITYRVNISDHPQELVFYKSKKSDRWWMNVPFLSDHGSKYERHHMVPCSYRDYEQACQDDLPDRWWQAYQKLN
ncbi:MAG: formimidoylglutamase [Flavobacteriales bacterium]|nr:formimidoylglutamase [Flavobacteriales bacterium]MCB9449442.1 formimidoylglutamase [Flavobacteriales bacterium]